MRILKIGIQSFPINQSFFKYDFILLITNTLFSQNINIFVQPNIKNNFNCRE